MMTGQGAVVELANKLGSGGEGAVYALASHPQSVAKIYHHVPDSQKQAKLGAMVRGCDDDLQKIAAWPTETLEKDGAVIGFVMPLLRDCQPVHHLYNPGQRKQFFPQADYAFLVHTARNIAAAFATIHRHGHAVGDVNQGNLVVKADGTVSFIDCDSFQIQVEHKHFLCEVGVAHFTAPELQGKAFAQIVTTPDHDNFGLAVLIFHLLMMGRHPFAGVYSGEGDMPIEQAIREFRYAYGQDAAAKQMRPPPHSIQPDILSPDLAVMFERTFALSSRPTAQEWLAVLDSFASSLRQCSQVAIHKYPLTMMGCPWCYYTEYKQLMFFNQSVVAHKRRHEVVSAKTSGIGPSFWLRKLLSADSEASRFDRPFDLLVYGLIGSWIWIGFFGSLGTAPAESVQAPQPVIADPLLVAKARQKMNTPTIGENKEAWYSLFDRSQWRRIDRWGAELSQRDLEMDTAKWAAIVDTLTGLEWTVGEVEGQIGFRAVNQRLEHMHWAGHDDWRLPTPRELHTLREASSYQEFARYFPGLDEISGPAYFWVSDGRSAASVMESIESQTQAWLRDRPFKKEVNEGRAFNFMDNSSRAGGSNYVLFVRGKRY